MSHRHVIVRLALLVGLLLTTSVFAADAGREVLGFNQGWRFFRPPEKAAAAPTAPVYRPPAAALLKQGAFVHSTAPQDVMVAEHTARYICLESLSALSGKPFASVAEFYLLDDKGQVLPRTDWTIAWVDSENRASDDLAGNAIDGDPATMWHTQWNGGEPDHPHQLIVNLGRPTKFSGFRYLARHDGNSVSMIKDYRFYALDQIPAGLETPAAAAEEKLPQDDASWEIVNLPHTVRLEPLNAAGGRNYQGVCWYRRHFTVSDAWKGKKLLLRFAGAMATADLWLNGQKLASHYCGYLPFTVDISAAQGGGVDNVLTVRLDNADNPNVPPGKPQNALDFTYFGGLYRAVELDVLNPLHITDVMLANKPAGGGIFISYPAVSKDAATVQVQTEVINEAAAARDCVVTQEWRAADGTVVATDQAAGALAAGASYTFTQHLQVQQPKLWHPDHPYLYTLHTTIAAAGATTDTLDTRSGIRSLRFDTKEGMFINGERYFSLGCNRHQDHPYVGYALGAANHWRDVKKLRETGFTSIRSHYPQDPAFVDACDELGMLLIVSNPGWQFVGGPLFTQRVYQDCRDMIRRDRNHPCVILWEAQLNESPNKPLFPMLEKIVHEEFPFDPCYAAGDSVAAKPEDPDWDMVYGGDKHVRPNWWREWGDHVDNWSDQQSPVRIARGWGETPQLVQAWSHINSLNSVMGTYETVRGDPATLHLCGADLWAGVDAYRGYHHQPFLGGPIDLFRLPKLDAYFFQSQRPPGVHVPGLDDGPMVFIANYATFQSPTNITVFSNCDAVRLTQNGKEVGTSKPLPKYAMPHPPFTFQVNPFSGEQSTLFMTGVGQPGTQIGELKAEGLIDGKVAATHIVKAPGVPRKIMLAADLCGRDLVADGAAWVRVYARVCDERGTTHPYADDRITFTVEGAGQIINDARIGANPVRAEAGIATVLVRAGRHAGPIKVQAEGFDLKPGEITFEAQPLTTPEAPGKDVQDR